MKVQITKLHLDLNNFKLFRSISKIKKNSSNARIYCIYCTCL